VTHGRRLAGTILLSTALAGAAVTAPALASVARHHGGTRVTSVKTSLGRVVSNHKGRVMFRFLRDTPNKSHCSAACRTFWPPVKSASKARAGRHISAAHLGRTSKGQVTYYGHPLYYFVGDPHPGKTTGDGKKEFGARWYIVSTHGKAVHPRKRVHVALPTGPAAVSTGMAGAATVVTDAAGGHTLYELTADSPPSFACTAGCVKTWHPLLTKGAPTASGGANAMLLGTVHRTIGGQHVVQVTYNGYALYRFSGDTKAGQAKGEAAYEDGGYWYDVMPNGVYNL
jgi:predicted lipoprotein with Yx(FWY)xxD motif